MRLSSAPIKVIRQNLAWAFHYNILLIPVAAGLLPAGRSPASPALADGTMALERHMVANSLRLRAFQRRRHEWRTDERVELRPMATDPVCGMEVNREVATAQDLTAEPADKTFFFCPRACGSTSTTSRRSSSTPSYQPHM